MSVSVKTKWQGNIKFESEGQNTGFKVNMDANKEAGGDASASSPMEMLLHGVAGCMGIDICVIMRHNMDEVKNLELEVVGTRNDEAPKFYTDVVVKVHVEGNVPAKTVKRAVELSHDKYCSAINSLKAKTRVETYLNGSRVD